MKDSRELLLFDLGGVLVEYTGLRDIRGVLSKELSADEIRQLVAETAQVWSDFETGLLSPAEFHSAFAAGWPIGVTSDAFLTEFESWVRCIYPGVTELLESLRPNFRLAALSNTNALHWRRMCDELCIEQHFERVFASHELGLRKPAPEAYLHVLREMDVRPDDVTFFDDVEANVEAARQLGLRAYRVEGVEALRSCLLENGYLS